MVTCEESAEPLGSAVQAEIVGLHVIDRNIPKRRDGNHPGDKAPGADCANPKNSLEEQIMHKDNTERCHALRRQPHPARKPGAAGQQHAECQQSTKGCQPEDRIRYAEQARLVGFHDRAAAEHRVDIAAGVEVRIHKYVDFVVCQDERCEQPDKGCSDQNVWQCYGYSRAGIDRLWGVFHRSIYIRVRSTTAANNRTAPPANIAIEA